MHLPQPAVTDPTPTAPRRGALKIAHRGASDDVAENTLAAIRRAVEVGADSVELDVQRSKDGALVLLHDTTLARTTDAQQVFPHRGPWRVADFSHDELRRLDAGSWKSADSAGESVPSLREAIEVIRDSGVGLLLELKAPELYPGIVWDVVACMRDLPAYTEQAVAGGRLVVQSFNYAVMKDHKVYAPEIPVGLLGTPSRAPPLAESRHARAFTICCLSGRQPFRYGPGTA